VPAVIRRLVLALRFWRDPVLGHTWLSAWRIAKRLNVKGSHVHPL